MNIPHPKETVGQPFDIELMRYAQAQSWRALKIMSAEFRPGMRESEAKRRALDILNSLGMERIWHPVHVRFGANTLKTAREKSDDDPILGHDDIYFIDIGTVFQGHEGDVGATFTTGQDPEKVACAAAAKTLFDDVRNAWHHHGITGPALYELAARSAETMGWVLNLDVRGHRICDYPHAIHRGGALGAFEGNPAAGVWVLEIQITNWTRSFGAFYEDMLI